MAASFSRELERRFPQFKPVKPRRKMPIWAWEVAPNLTFFVLLQPLQDEDQFAVEVAWNDGAKFPWGGLNDPSETGSVRGRVRISWMWATGNEAPLWDLSPEATAAMERDLEALANDEEPPDEPDPPVETVLARVDSLVADAINKLAEYGMPLLRRVAERRGVKWPED